MDKLKFLKYNVEIPGKIIITGEHAVIYGSKVLSCAINKRLYGRIHIKQVLEGGYVNVQSDMYKSLNIKMYDILVETIKNQNIGNYYKLLSEISLINLNKGSELSDFINSIKSLINPDLYTECENVLLFVILFIYTFYEYRSHLSQHFKDIEYDKLENTLLLSILKVEGKLDIKSEIPIGSGLGSSGTFAICISDFISKIFKCIMNWNFSSYNNGKSIDLINNDFSLVKRLSLIGENFLHSKTTGADVIVSLVGNIVVFSNAELYEKLVENNLKMLMKSIKIFLINTKTSRLTKESVSKIFKSNKCHEEVLSSIREIADKIINVFNGKSNYDNNDILSLISENQKYLKTLGVTTQIIDRFCEEFTYHNDIAVKISGAGCGGHLVSFVLNNQNSIHKLIQKCFEYRFDFSEIEISNTGYISQEMSFS